MSREKRIAKGLLSIKAVFFRPDGTRPQLIAVTQLTSTIE